MTKRTVTTKRGQTKAKANGAGKPIPFRPTNGIERAAERAKLAVAAPWPGEPNPGKAMLEALRQADWPGDHLAILRKHAQSYEQAVADLSIERKEEAKAEGKPDPYRAAMEHVTTRFGEALVRTCDILGEELATYNGEDTDGDDYNVKQALRVLWELRWELGIGTDGKATDFAVERATERAKGQSNGAAACSEVAS